MTIHGRKDGTCVRAYPQCCGRRSANGLPPTRASPGGLKGFHPAV